LILVIANIKIIIIMVSLQKSLVIIFHKNKNILFTLKVYRLNKNINSILIIIKWVYEIKKKKKKNKIKKKKRKKKKKKKKKKKVNTNKY